MAFAQVVIDQNQTGIYGEAVADRGLCVRQAVNGYGLETFGFIWQGPEIWIKENSADGIVTTWTSSQSVITTVWTSSQSSITTTWTPSTVFGYGNEFPEIF